MAKIKKVINASWEFIQLVSLSSSLSSWQESSYSSWVPEPSSTQIAPLGVQQILTFNFLQRAMMFMENSAKMTVHVTSIQRMFNFLEN